MSYRPAMLDQKIANSDSAETSANGLTTEDWLALARETLIKEGVDAVKIDRLAKMAGVTRGGFYWRFKSRNDLLDQLLEDWRATNTAPILETLEGDASPEVRIRNLFQLWIEEQRYKPDYDLAVRGWAAVSPRVAEIVREVDEIRVGALRRLFCDSGYDEAEAEVRARITYYHQVGYYAMGVSESTTIRRDLSPLYYSVLTGFPH